MIIYKPPHRVEGAPNLSKGIDVFSVTANMAHDKIITIDPAEEPVIGETIELLRAIHGEKYVNAILAGTELNGYGSRDSGENFHSVFSCAIMRDAALTALRDPKTPVFAPVSGFHHAGYGYCGGYCTFNGLILAAMAVYEKKPDAKILIIDGDGHFGDGTADLINKLGLDWLSHLSLSKSSVRGDYPIARGFTNTWLNRRKWDLVIYQAGADSHADDPYYSGYLTDGEWLARDAQIFGHCHDTETPIVFALAGGYNGSKTILLHSSTVSTTRSVYQEPARAHLSPSPDHG